ncbi:AEC family transporter [Blautia sp. HCP3S3_G3]|uniref:AEC family transporter n=1 Tax=Blautia sp. HCP3S3_G3 TaxID=3438913 RepID=UPI003F8A7BAB
MFLLIFNQLLKMLFIMLLAVICFKIGLINQEGNRNLSNLLLMVINPCVILTVYQTDYEPRLVKGLLISFAAAVIAHILAIAIARVLIRAKDNRNYAIERFAAVYSNCGFIGIPLINSVLGSEGVFYLTAYMTVFNILAWTHGLTLLTKKFDPKCLKEGILSPIVLATLAAMALFFAQIRIPDVLLDSMTYVADMNTPVAMMIAGFSLAQTDLKKTFTHVRLYWVSFVKLLAVPFAVLIFLGFFHLDYTVAYTTLIAAACPVSATTTMMCIRLNDNYTYASEIFSFTTVLSIVTIPLVAFAASFVL